MSSPESISPRALYLRIAAVALLLLVCAVLGAFLGWWSAPKPMGTPLVADAAGDAVQGDQSAKALPPFPPNRPPLFFYAGASAGSEPSVTDAEIGMAALAGIHQVIVPTALPWDDDGFAAVLAAIQRVQAADPECAVVLEVDCDPPAGWLLQHPDEQSLVDKVTQPYASVASKPWREEAGARLEALLQMLHVAPERRVLLGLILVGGGNNQWQMEGVDRSKAMTQAYRDWLAQRYAADTALAAAWGEKKASLKNAEIPALKNDPDAPALLRLPGEQAAIDYARCASDATVGAIAWLATRARAAGWPGLRLYAPYGFSLESTSPVSGHHALGRLLESPLDGFISPFSYVDRGLGGSGGFMGAVHGALYRGKQWICVDDTRTGVSRDAITGSITRLEGLREEDVHNVQARNFALALVNGVGMVWSDPMGEGTLHDEGVWQRIGQMREIYETAYPSFSQPAEGGNPGMPPPPPVFQPALIVVLDEAAMATVRPGSPLGDQLLHAVRDAALRSGMPVQFCLLSDFLENRNPPANVYLFANAFSMDEAQRVTAHARLAKEQAYAIWLYAPGYYSASSGTDGISKTVGMTVKAFKDPSDAGSAFLLTGRWVDEGKPLESPTRWNPLFYVEDPESDALARYVAVERVSVAMRSMPEGWASIYIAEPNLTPALLREVMSIIEQPIYVRPAAQRHFDAIYSNRTLFAIHGNQVGERTIDLGSFSDTIDLFNPGVGWPQKDSFVLPLKTGETRLMKVSPMEGLTPAPEEEPLPDEAASGDAAQTEAATPDAAQPPAEADAPPSAAPAPEDPTDSAAE